MVFSWVRATWLIVSLADMSLWDMADCILIVYDYGEMFDCILTVYELGRHGWLCMVALRRLRRRIKAPNRRHFRKSHFRKFSKNGIMANGSHSARNTKFGHIVAFVVLNSQPLWIVDLRRLNVPHSETVANIWLSVKT